MKYRGSRRVAVMMGERIARTLAVPDADCLVPVPLHKDSSRDYNQARLIAAGAGRVWGIPVISALAWSRNVPGQARKRGADERFLPDGVIIVSKDVTPYRRICLIDDVHTTGNTLRAAASALERAGRSVTAAMVWSVS
jgi:predicted amidophosphoribosyltransferase